MFTFNSQIQLGSKIPEYSELDIKNETMLFSSDLDFAWENGGIITRSFIDALPDDWKNSRIIIDSRTHMLFAKFWPCIPGWHHDDVPRSREDQQPNYHTPEYRSEHVMCLANGDICPTQYALGQAEFPDVPVGDLYYKVWHPLVERKIQSGELTSFSAPSNQLIFFNDRSWHQGIRAVRPGWRWFIRASRNTDRKITNEIRNQVQVYLEFPMEGW